VLSDLRFALRSLAKSPGFAAVTILSLALGIGANTAIFSLVNEVLLKALPVRDPEQLVLFNWSAPPEVTPQSINGWTQRDPATRETTCTSFSLATFAAFRAGATTLSDVFAFSPLDQVNVIIGGQAQMVRDAQVVSGNYYAAVGVPMAAGRALTPADDQPAAMPVAVISYRFWQRNFAGSAAALSQVITVNHVPVTIVGVTAPQFTGTGQAGEVQDLTLPLALYGQIAPDDTDALQPWSFWVRLMGRLKPGATVERTQASLAPLFNASIKDALDAHASPDAVHLHAHSGAQGLVEARRDYAQSLTVLLVLVGLVLLVACANVANLLLARGAARRREIAVRLALGAGRPRLLRQLLTESVLLALLGAAVGLLLAIWSRDALLALQPLGTEGLNLEMTIDWRVLGFTTAVAVGTGLLFGLAPAWRATRLNPAGEFQGGMRTLGGARSRLAKSLMVVQVALSLVLLIGAGLFTRTLRNLQHVNPGFNPSGLLLFRVDAMSAGHTREELPALYGRLADRLATLPGVERVTFSQVPLLAHSSWTSSVTLQDRPQPEGNDANVVMNGVDPAFFATYQLPLRLGRGFTAGDAGSSPRVAVVNEAFARKFYGARPALGHFIGFGGAKNGTDIEIVGVVADAKYVTLEEQPRPTAFFPFGQIRNARLANFALRVVGDPLALGAAVRGVLREVDPALPLDNLRTQEAQIASLLTGERLFARLSAFFGLLATALAAVGLYGLMSYSVLQRTGELGLRMALGAPPAGLLRMIVLETLALVASGSALGALGAWALSRLVRSLLYGLTPTDAATYAGTIFLLLVIGFLAAWLPARRAARIDPMVALRSE